MAAGRGRGITKSFDLSACFLNMRLKTHFRFGIFKGGFLQKFGQKYPRLDSPPRSALELMLAVGFASVCSITVSSLRYTYSVRVELNHLFYYFFKGKRFYRREW